MRYLLPLVITTLFSAQPAFSQSQPTTQLTLQQAVELALENNFTVKKAENNLELQDGIVTQSIGQFLPNLNASMNANRRTGRQFVQERLQFDEFTTRGISGGISTSVPLFAGFQNISNLRAAQARRLSSEEVLQRTKENIIFQTASSFLTVLLNQELLTISIQDLESAQRQLDQIRAQVEVGMRPIVDQYNQEALVANSEFLLVQRENAVNISLLQLVRIMQIDPLLEYELVTPGIEEATVEVKTFDLNQLVTQALANRSDISAQEAQIKASKYALNAARGAYLPTLSFSANLNSNYTDQYREPNPAPPPATRKLGFNDQFFDRNPTRSIGLSLQIPIFNRFGTRTNVQRSQVQYKNDLLDMEDRRLGILQEVRQAHNDYLAYAKQLKTTETALIAATKAYETEQERYRVGASTLIELTRANTEFVNASSNRVRAVYQFVFQEKLLDYYIGNITTNIEF
jgi:outer membrane protein